MNNFGEQLRKERISRGIALEQISAVTKISQRHLIALEQERFRLLPGGILSKGIVRGYVSASDSTRATGPTVSCRPAATGQTVRRRSELDCVRIERWQSSHSTAQRARNPHALDRRNFFPRRMPRALSSPCATTACAPAGGLTAACRRFFGPFGHLSTQNSMYLDVLIVGRPLI